MVAVFEEQNSPQNLWETITGLSDSGYEGCIHSSWNPDIIIECHVLMVLKKILGLARFEGGYYLAIESEDVGGDFMGSIVTLDASYVIQRTNYVDYSFETDNKGIEGPFSPLIFALPSPTLVLFLLFPALSKKWYLK